MGTITALTQQVRNPERISVFVDDAFVCGLAAAVAAGLRVGQSINSADLAQLEQNELAYQARQRVLRLLLRRPQSAAEIRRYLRRHQYDDELITHLVDDLTEAGLIDDDAFAAYWVEQRETFRPRSRLALRQELGQKGVDRDVVADAVAEVDETDAARRLATRQARRYQHLPPAEWRAKLTRYLMRHGFPYEIAGDVVDQLVNDAAADPDGSRQQQLDNNVKE